MSPEGRQLALPIELSEPAGPEAEAEAERPARVGGADIEYVRASGILTQSSGFIGAFDYTLNPYSGCSFGCSYCYAAAFVRDPERREGWGSWVRVKENALELLRRRRRRPLDGATIYLSSVTDAYQPVERRLGLTRAILEELAEHHRVRLVVQTRSPLVTRDIDVLRHFAATRVNMTITTDDDEVRRIFEPGCASVGRRLRAIAEVAAAGIPACVTMTPLLPLRDPAGFAARLRATGATRFVAQYLHPDRGHFAAGTRAAGAALSRLRGWDEAAYLRALGELRALLPELEEGRDGFVP